MLCTTIADGANVVATNHVIGRFHIDGRFVVKAFEVAAGLREKNELDAFTGITLGEFEGAVGTVAGGFIVDHGTLDDATGGAFATTDDVEIAAVVFADESGDFRGADFDGTDEGRLRTHGTF
jgi:hypothetical protein